MNVNDMCISKFKLNRDRRFRLSLSADKLAMVAVNKIRIGLTVIVCSFYSFGTSSHAVAQVPRKPLKRPPIVGNRPVRPAASNKAEQMMARKLIRMMLRPAMPYTGVQETLLQDAGGMGSIQDIEGDTNGFQRIQFRSPSNLTGDVMIISPGSFHSYHRAKNLLEVAPWPTDWNDEGKRMIANLANGTVNGRLIGTETVAGRSAGIVVLSIPDGTGGEGRVLRKLWIDQTTGILLGIQKSNARGQITSSTMMTSINVSPTTPINPADFKPQFPGADVSALFPEPQYRTLQEAQGHLPFTPVEPAAASLPTNYHLDGVWGFGDDRLHPYSNSVLMRFTDGVASFSLYQRLIPPAKAIGASRPLPRSFVKNQQAWRVVTPQGEMNVQYIGHMTRGQVESLYNSLH